MTRAEDDSSHDRDAKLDGSTLGWAPEEIRRTYEEHAADVRLFLVGVVRDVHLADDLLHGVFSKLLERSHQVRRETLRGWLFQVAWNEVQLHRRQEGVRVRHEQSETMRQAGRVELAENSSPLEQLVGQESVEQMRRRIAELPEELRRIVEARMRDSKTLSAIATELGIPPGTVASRFQTALRRLKEGLS